MQRCYIYIYIYIHCWGVTEYMYRRYVFRIQIIANCIPLQLQFKLLVFRIQLHCWNQWITWRYFCFSSLFVLSHQQHLVRTKRVWSPWFGTFALVWMQPPHFDVNQISRPRPPWTAGLGSLPNEPWYGSLEMWKRTHLGPIQFYKAYASLDVTGTTYALSSVNSFLDAIANIFRMNIPL